MREPSPRQLDVMRAVAAFVNGRGYPPTIRELGMSLGITFPGVAQHLNALARKGLVTRAPAWTSRSRGTVLTAAAWSALGLDPPPPPKARHRSIAPIVAVNLGWRCAVCNAQTFDASKPCPICALQKRESAA
jgi:hypothetical protein